MAFKVGTVTGHTNLFQTIRSFLKGEGYTGTPSYTGTGNGTITNVAGGINAITETWTITCTTAATNGGTFSVVGSVSGAKANATVGTPYNNGFLSFTINDGTTDFIVGDFWTIAVTIGELSFEGRKWTELEYSNPGYLTSGIHSIMKAPGLAGTDEIFMGFGTYESIPSDYYNFYVAGFTGYVNTNTFATQPGYSGSFGVPMWNQSIPYWLVADGQSCICVAKIQNVYVSFFMGFLLPLGATPSQYPYPLCIGGCLTSASATRYSDVSYNSWHVSVNSGTCKLRLVSGSWSNVEFWPQNNVAATIAGGDSIGTTLRNSTNNSGTASGDYPIYPLQVMDNSNLYGFVNKVYYIPGYNNSSENTLTLSGVTYVTFPNIWRTTDRAYFALKLA